GKTLIGTSVNVPAILNRHLSGLRLGGHENRELQKDWNEFGSDAFEFETLDLLKPSTEPGDNVSLRICRKPLPTPTGRSPGRAQALNTWAQQRLRNQLLKKGLTDDFLHHRVYRFHCLFKLDTWPVLHLPATIDVTAFPVIKAFVVLCRSLRIV